ncbi:hypothetical protein HDU97_009949 [Phlyctochytrium planicorne]|nr:hypothetical protein HDU97_009949 [Phlyctochytrium planicorne]
MALASTALAFGSFALEGLAREFDRTKNMSKEELRKDRSDGFFKIKPDPYADRWAKIQAREAEKEA